MEQTNFFEFNLPEYSDSVDIEKINENTAKMDQALMAGLCTKTSTGSSIGDGTMAGSPKAWAPYFEIKNDNNVDVVVTDRNYGESLVTYTVEAGKTFRKYINGIYRMNFTVADSYEVEFKYFVDAQTAIDEIEPSGGGSVTSVAVQGYTGSHITATGGPITSSGTITLNVAAGYSIPSDEDQAAWSGKQNAIDNNHKISADNVDDASATNKFTNATERQTWNAKAADIKFEINSSTYVITAQLKDSSGNLIGTEKTIDLPLETMVISGTYDDTTEKIVLTLKNGQTVEFSVAALVSGLQTELSSSNKLDPSFIAYDSTHAAVTDADKSAYAAKYDKPSGGIPSSDMSSAVQNSLSLADSALQTETDPTVPSWAKQSNKPTYTAVEVGAADSITIGSSPTKYEPDAYGNINLPAYPSDTNTHRPIQLKGTEILGDNTTALNFAEGSNISLSNSGGTITISATGGSSAVTGVKGSNESTYRTGNVSLSYSNVGAASSGHTHSTATTSSSGFMSYSDKSKLNSLTPSTISLTPATSTVTIVSSSTYACNGLAWICMTLKNSASISANTEKGVATIESTYKHIYSGYVLGVMGVSGQIAANKCWITTDGQGIGIVSSASIPANTNIILTFTYRYA